MDEPLPIDTGTSALGQVPVAAEDPVARVLIDHPVPHLARAFDYAVPEKFADTARPGVRVRVKFAGKLRDGFLLERVESSDHIGPLATIERITSPVAVLTPELLRLGTATARRYAGTLSDVLRLAIPPRHARAEKAVLKAEKTREQNASSSSAPTDSGNASTASENSTTAADNETATAEDTVGRLGEWVLRHSPSDQAEDFPAAEHPRIALTCVPGPTPGLSWITAGLAAARATLAAGESVLWLVPDHRELAVLSAALDASADIDSHSVLSADQSPEQRWNAWLRGLLGHTRITIGTRAAAFAPVADLGLIICFDDSNSNYLDQH
ncbi:MAG: primosomal protein N', partial [Brevibacterium aurantiacum]